MFLSDDDMVECPYNKSHRMLRKRLQSHLLKCRLSYPDVELRKCPFNITHLIPEPEFTHHATNCPDRKLITQYKYDAPEQKEEEGPKHAPIECDEDWDDTNVIDYNPRQYVEKANVIRKPEGYNPSIRKIFIKKERKRLGDGDEDDEDNTERNDMQVPPPPLYSNHEESEIDEDSGKPRVDKSLKNHYRYDTTAHSSRTDWQEASSSFNAGGSRRKKRWSSPLTSTSAKHRSRSPNRSDRDRSRSPNRSDRDRSRSPGSRSYGEQLPLRSSPDYSRRYSPPANAVCRTFDAYNPDEDPYYNGGSVATSFNSSRAYYDRSSEASTTLPQMPPPPMISYPSSRSYLATKERSSTGH